MTPYTRLKKKVDAGLRPLRKDVDLLVAYHDAAIACARSHGCSDQYYIAKYKLEQLNTQLHGTNYDYSALVIQPAEEVVRLEKLIKKYRKILKKRGYRLTFWHWRKTKHNVPDNFPEIQKFMRWYEHRLQRRKQRV